MKDKIALVFSGIGTQWHGMAEAMLANDAVFRAAVAELDGLLTPLQDWSLLDLLSGRSTHAALDRPEIAHPCIFAVQHGLSACLQQQGLRPAAVIGHSAGEVAAAVCAGVLNLPDAARLVAAQCELIRAVQPGAMMHVALDPQAVVARIAAADSGLELAAVNSHLAVVVATQNPVEYEGTFPLPEAQLDRFLLRIRLGYPSFDDEIEIIDRQQFVHPIDSLQPVASPQDLLAIQRTTRSIYVDVLIKHYIVNLVAATRNHPDIALGASPRATLSLVRTAQTMALLRGRDYVIPDDVKELARPVMAHRIIVAPGARMRGLDGDQVVGEVLERVTVPGVRARG